MRTLPPTALLLTENDMVIGHFKSYGDIARHLGISVSDEGRVTLMGKEMGPTYCMEDTGSILNNSWGSAREVENDWAVHYMSKNLPKRYCIYRYLTTS